MKPSYRLPYVTLLLVIANIAAAYALTWDPLLIDSLGFLPNHPSIKTAIICLFLHENLIHLCGNLIFLIAVGGSVELATGSFRFFAVYFISGLAGVGFHYLATRHAVDPRPLIGASAAVAGCAGYYAVRYTKLRVPVAPKISLSILTITLIWFALQVLGAIVRFGDTQTAVAYWAHIGGFVVGLALCFIFRAPDIGQTEMDKKVLDAARLKGPMAQLEAMKEFAMAHPQYPNALRDWAEAAAQLDEPDEEFNALIKLIDIEDQNEKIDDLARICEIKRASGIASITRLNYAKAFRDESPATSIRLLESIIIEVESPVTPEALFTLSDILLEIDKNRANQYLLQLKTHYSEHPAYTRAKARGWIS